MLEGLDRIDWKRLTHAYGPASDTPGLIRALASPNAEERKDARGGLYYTIGHQGDRYAATAPAVPFLFELLDAPVTPEKDQLIRLLVHLAVGYHERFLPLGIDPATAFAAADAVTQEEADAQALDDYSEEVATFWARSAYEAVLRGAGRFRSLADSPDADSRQAAVFALAWLPAAATESVLVVRRICRGPAEPAELANAILCLGILDRYLSDASDAPWLQEQLGTDRPYLVRVTAAISLAVLLGQELPAEGLDVLLEALQHVGEGEEEETSVAWTMGGLLSHVCAVLRLLALEPTEPVLSALCHAAETLKTWASLDAWRTLLEMAFPDGQGTRYERDPTLASGQRVIYRDVAGFTDPQRRAVEAIVRSPHWERWQNSFGPWEEELWAYGLPTDPGKLRKLLANEPLDPPPPAAPPEPELDIYMVAERAREYAREFQEHDRLFPLRGEIWYTGFSPDGRQMLVRFDNAAAFVCWFDEDGHHLNTDVVSHSLGQYPGTYWQREKYPQTQVFLVEQFGYRDGTIHIRRFQDPVSETALKPGPWWFERFMLDPEWSKWRQYEAKRVLEWAGKRDRYVLTSVIDYHIDIGDGHCAGSN